MMKIKKHIPAGKTFRQRAKFCKANGHKWVYNGIESIKVAPTLYEEREIFFDWTRVDLYKCMCCGKIKKEII